MDSLLDALLYAPGTVAGASSAVAVVGLWILVGSRRRRLAVALVTLAPVSPLLLLRWALVELALGIDRLEELLPGADRRKAAALVLVEDDA